MWLFLYGTLQPQMDTPMARWLRRRTEEALPAHVPGRLMAIPAREGWYPALLPGSARCRGTLVRVDLSQADLVRLDRYEGAEYRRAVLRAQTARGNVTCQGYVWRGRLPPGALRIADGDFRKWLERTGQRGFGSPPLDPGGRNRWASPVLDPHPRACHRAPP